MMAPLSRAISLQFALEGTHVVLVSNVKDEVESVAKEVRDLGREAIAYAADVTDPVEISHMAVYLASDKAKAVTGQAKNHWCL